jgi:peptidoglycan hydrolase-like protein with peptidoglycan-binding domain
MSNATYYWGGNDLKVGSTGRDVEQWQTFLKNQGYYNGAIDGDFGSVTDAATKAYQSANGLASDGIAGVKTMAKAGFVNYNTPVSAPTAATLPTYTPRDTTSYDDTEEGAAAKAEMDTAADNKANYGDFSWDKQGEYDTLYKKLTERDPFSYDFNADALYQQYKDRYIQQGKMAMQDVMGQAAAMTGGYGNSYAASVGNQAYQQSLQQLNDVIPELYQLAYSKYNQEGHDMLNALGLLEGDRAFKYGLYTDKYGRLTDVYDMASDAYYKGGDMFYTEQDNKNAATDAEFNAAMALVDTQNEQAWKTADWNETQRLDARDNAGGFPSGGPVDDPIDNKGTLPSGAPYDNGGYASDVVKNAQKFVGAGEDGMWGPNSQAAAKAKGYDSIADVVAAMGGGGGDDIDYSGWDGGDWNSYFAQIRQSEGKAAAEKELNDFIGKGLIPTNMIDLAATGARGSLGH